MELRDYLKNLQRIAIAFSGGVDSAYLLYEALQSGVEVKAYYVKSAFQPAFELEDAKRFAKLYGADLDILSLDVLQFDDVVANPSNRCYFCKQQIFGAIIEAAAKDGFTILCDGTNISDDEGDRPGMQALNELSVKSPLRDCGLTKTTIRERSKDAGLFTWDKPSYACLATRIKTNEAITGDKLAATERAENFLFGMGFHDFRVRRIGDMAKLELTKEDLTKALSYREAILNTLKSDYSKVVIDLELRDE
ncbi:ATP-dependent sacrificial sulfur transferase LarE [Peptoniphilus equinus]|uniref:ATP-dependent sacrificial sulfur transferase LarE n=1 Tax=Peptoniphilus equinus TaxID=3016343 RepID=A0ABY7QRC6_9FIRM|nr:ATP-dependent sacrificial sulfur transferase LarE [Peptoniphilus equinus]WBW49340.1 ATP-dependent sacrificial sulfur transferase LarE [Peptoniphilus equinus]